MGTRHTGTAVSHDTRPAAEEIAEMLGDPLPPDWQEPSAVEGRQECLAGAAYAAADAVLEFLVVRVDLRRRDRSPIDRVVDALLDLERAWRAYTHSTQRDDAGTIVFEAAEYWGGAAIATIVEGVLEAVWEDRRRQNAEWRP